MSAKINYIAIMAFNSFRYVIGAYETYQEAYDIGYLRLRHMHTNWKRNKGAKPKLLICAVTSDISLT